MKIIKTANYIKLFQNVMTPDLEDQFVDSFDRNMRKRRELELTNKPGRGILRKDVAKGINKINPKITDEEWRRFVQNKEREKQKEEERYLL